LLLVEVAEVELAVEVEEPEVLELLVHFQFVEQQHIQLQLGQVEQVILRVLLQKVLQDQIQYFQQSHQQAVVVEV
jgi:hypothetical protein